MKNYFKGAVKIFLFTLMNASVFSTGLFWLVYLTWNNSIGKIFLIRIGWVESWFLLILCVMLFKTNMVAYTNERKEEKPEKD